MNKMVKRIIYCISICFLLSCSHSDYKLILHRKIPYPQSKFIKSFSFTGEPVRYPGSGSDMHWYTWGIDDHIYIVDDDGQNFNGYTNYAHVLRIKGIPPHHTLETVTDFENYDFRAKIPYKLYRRYVDGILAVDSVLYVCIYDYDWEIPGKVYDFDDMHRRAKLYSAWEGLTEDQIENMSFVDGFSKNGGIAGIIASYDFGKTWVNIPDTNTPQFLGPRFAGMSFLTWGPGYSNTPAELGDYVYGISNDGNWESGDNVFMARVHKDSVLNRNAWSFFVSHNNMKSEWTKLEDAAQPIFTDSGHVGHPTMMYNPALDRYIMMIYSDTIPHRMNASREERAKWDKASELQIYEAPTPFGPWSIFYNEVPWGGKNHSCYLGQMPAKWLNNSGTAGYIMFAGDYADAKHEYYGLMVQPYKLELFKKTMSISLIVSKLGKTNRVRGNKQRNQQ